MIVVCVYDRRRRVVATVAAITAVTVLVIVPTVIPTVVAPTIAAVANASWTPWLQFVIVGHWYKDGDQ